MKLFSVNYYDWGIDDYHVFLVKASNKEEALYVAKSKYPMEATTNYDTFTVKEIDIDTMLDVVQIL